MAAPAHTINNTDVDIRLEKREFTEHHEVSPTAADDPEASKNSASHQRMAEFLPVDKRILWKLDVLLIPVIAMLYLLVFIDRTNIGNARVAGLQRDLNLTDHQYKTAVTVTYVLYIAAELPSNLMLKKIGPRRLLPGLCLTWGIVTTLQCLIHDYSGLLGARLMLGLAEGGLFPGINLYLSMFYRRDELQLRIALFYSFSALSGAFSGLLAAAISNMDGIGGLSGWQWIFCLEGLFTVLFAPVAYWLMPNNPQEVRLFTETEAARCSERLRLDAMFPDEEKVTLRAALSVYTSVHTWPLFIIMFCIGCCVFGLAFFTPTIVSGMEFSPIQTQLMTVPPFAVAFVVCLVTAYFADRYQKRGIMALVTVMLALIGVVMFHRGRSTAVRYTALFFLITGCYANGPCLLAWVPNNTAAHTRRATAIATAFCCTNTGGIVSTWIFPQTDAPYYPFASKFILSLVILTLVAIAAELKILSHLNKAKMDPDRREVILRDVQHLDFAQQMIRLGDSHPDYKYIL